MENNFHDHLKKSFGWYRDWHDHPHHPHAHWAFFTVVAILLFTFVSSGIRDFYLESFFYFKCLRKI